MIYYHENRHLNYAGTGVIKVQTGKRRTKKREGREKREGKEEREERMFLMNI